jgi:hypothetical protein
MKKETSLALKKYFLTVLLFFFFAVLLLVGQNLINKQTETSIKKTATTVLKNWKDSAPSVGDRIILTSKGLSYAWTFDAITKGKKNGMIFVTTVTGNSGPYTGVFIYTAPNGVQFCGLAGISGDDVTPEKYGISERIINARIKTISAIAGEYGALK